MTLTIQAEPIPLVSDQHGVMRVGGTRISLDTVVEAFYEGATAEEIVQQYPSLDLADVYAVLAYYLRHRTEVQTYLAQRQQQAQHQRLQNEQRFAPDGVRARLLARQSARA